MDLFAMLPTAIDVAKAAGDILRRYYAEPLQSNHKGSIDLVTEADHASEAFLVSALQTHFPQIGIIGEEGADYLADEAEYFWFVDPLDGTTNFAHKLPIFSVLLSLATRDYEPLMGVVYDPLRDECFYAVQGGGAWLNGTPIQVAQTPHLLGALLATGFPYDRHTSPENNLAEFQALMLQIQGGRRLGSAGLDLSYVACGRLDGYWEQKLNRWDVLGGMLIVREAGGIVTDYEGGEAELRSPKLKVIASNPVLHPQIQAVIAQARQGLA